MLVYRLESKTLKPEEFFIKSVMRGAYRVILSDGSVLSLIGTDGMWGDTPTSPSPHSDVKLRKQWETICSRGNLHANMVFGFESIESLKRWFFCDALLNYESEAQIGVYEVDSDKVHIGTAQVCFDHRYAYLDHTLLMSEVYK